MKSCNYENNTLKILQLFKHTGNYYLGEKVQQKNLEIKKAGGIGFKNFWNYIKASDALITFFIFVILKIGSVALYVLSGRVSSSFEAL